MPVEDDFGTAHAESGATSAGDLPDTVLARDYNAFLIMALANRLHRGASNYYQRRWNIGITEYRTLLALGIADGGNLGEVAAAADLDKAAVSRSLKQLEARGFVTMEQTRLRGRAAIVRLTAGGEALKNDLRAATQARDQRLVRGLSDQELEQFAGMIRRLMGNLDHMNNEE